MKEAIWLYCKNMQNLENKDVFEILITQKLLKSPKDPFVRSAPISNKGLIDTFLFFIVGNVLVTHTRAHACTHFLFPRYCFIYFAYKL